MPQRRKQVMKKKTKTKKPVEAWVGDGWSQGQCLSQDEGTIFQARGETGNSLKGKKRKQRLPCHAKSQVKMWSLAIAAVFLVQAAFPM